MINCERIGCGIVTCNRSNLVEKCHNSIKSCEVIDDIIIINDGNDRLDINLSLDIFPVDTLLRDHSNNMGVGKSKNEALQYLLDQNCDHIFLIEDDIYIKDPTVFEKYIQASKVSGIQHFNFSQHGMMNKTFDSLKTPNPRLIIDYKSSQIALYPHCVGAFSYYSRKCLEDVGLLDERYYNACEHVDHTYEIIKKGYHPPFWYFADIDKSWEYLGDEEWSLANSTISSNPNHKQMMNDADKIFVEKHGRLPVQIVLTSEDDVVKSLKEIKKTYAIDFTTDRI